jgi:hypothetical protein
MAVQFSIAVRNGMLDAVETAMGTGARLRLYSGTMPANCAAAASGSMLAEYVLAADWAGTAANGSKALNNLPLTTTAAVAGTIGYYRFYDSAGSVCHEQGTVTASGGGGDMTVDNPTLALNQTVNVTAFTKTAAGA